MIVGLINRFGKYYGRDDLEEYSDVILQKGAAEVITLLEQGIALRNQAPT